MSTTATGWVVPEQLNVDIVTMMLSEIQRGSSPAAISTDDQGFRAIAAHPRAGITLVVSGPALETDAWAQELDALTQVLRAVAGHLVYASIRRGWQPKMALIDSGPWNDWPWRPNDRPRGSAATTVAFEDLFAPDAFGVQLLGPGYGDRLPLGPPATRDWVSETLNDATLLSHSRPQRWFAHPPIVPVARNTVQTDPDTLGLLESARRDLHELLYQPGILTDRGFSDMADR